MDIFNIFYQFYLNYIYNYFKKWHIIGVCDTCKKYLYSHNNYLYLENMDNLSLCLQYCSDECLQKHRNKYNYLNRLNFKYNDINLYDSITQSSFINNLKFIFRYPETANLEAPELLEYIIELRNSSNLSKNNDTFLMYVKKYDIA